MGVGCGPAPLGERPAPPPTSAEADEQSAETAPALVAPAAARLPSERLTRPVTPRAFPAQQPRLTR